MVDKTGIEKEADQMNFKDPAIFQTASLATRASDVDLGALPEWRLDDLYSGMDSPAFAADSQQAVGKAKSFAATYRGKLEASARGEGAGEKLSAAVKAYEALQDLVGRIISYAGLVYAGDTSDPARAKFYGDVQQKVTDIAGDLLFFELELNRLDDALVAAALAAPALAPYRPWLEDIRPERPHQLGDEIEQLF